jgi:hypothetical protein
MWQRLSNPDVLVFLSASFETCTSRRKLNWTEADYLEQLRRLAHAREHAHLSIETDDLTPEDVVNTLLAYLDQVR